MKVTFKITREDYDAFIDWLGAKAGKNQQSQSASWILTAALGVSIGLMFAGRSSPGHGPLFYLGIGIQIGGAFIYGLWWWTAKHVKTEFGPTEDGYMSTENQVEIREEGIFFESPQHQVLYRWSLITGPELTGEHVFIQLDRLLAIVIPKRVFATESI